MPGPPPNPNARRRNAGSGFSPLPAAGRVGPPPPYPFRGDLCAYEGRRRELWQQLWATPMAVLWERHRWAGPVARYVEMTLQYEAAPMDAPGTLLSELRQAEQTLGMTPIGLLKSRAAVDGTTAAAQEAGASNVVLLTSRSGG